MSDPNETNLALELKPTAQEFLYYENHCVLCNTELHLVIEKKENVEPIRLKENAFCPSCGVRVRMKEYGLQ
jgi:hypothetical protein